MQSGTSSQDSSDIDLGKELERFELELIRNALIRSRGKQTAAAKMLNLKITTLNAKLKRYGIDPHSPAER